MRTLQYTISLFALWTFCSCKAQTSGYEVKGDINGLELTKVYIQALKDSSFAYIDSAEVNDGKFIFKGEQIDEPFVITIWLNDKKGGKEPLCSSFYLENSEISLSGDLKKRGEIKITGSKETIADRDINSKAGFSKRYVQIQNIFFNAQNNNRNIPDDSVTALSGELRALEKVRKESLLNDIKNHSDSYAALSVLLQNVNQFSPTELNELYNLFSEKIKKYPSYQRLGRIVNSSTLLAIGTPLKDFTLSDTSGAKHNLKSLKGQFVLVDFWASWCAPCRKQIPALKKIYEENKLKSFQIVGVSIDEDENKWKQALNLEKMPWVNVLGEKGGWAKETYLITAIPANFLLDTEGKIIGKDLSMAELKSTLERLLN